MCSYNQIHTICQETAKKIKQDNFQPEIILAIGGGGFIPARMLRTHLGVPIKTVSLELYDDKTKQAGAVVKTTQWIDPNDVCGKRVLIVDEVDDTRTTLAFCVQELRKMNPKKIGVFVLHNKRKEKKECSHWTNTGLKQEQIVDKINVDYYSVGEEIDDVWIVYPWESTNIDQHDILSQH